LKTIIAKEVFKKEKKEYYTVFVGGIWRRNPILCKQYVRRKSAFKAFFIETIYLVTFPITLIRRN